MTKIYTIFVKSEDNVASNATVAIKRYAKAYPRVNLKDIKAAPKSAVRTITTIDVDEGTEITTKVTGEVVRT